MNKIISILTVWAACVSLALAAPSAAESTGKPKRLVLIGASIGQAWDLPGLPTRVKLSGYEMEALQAWQYDKSELLDETLMRPTRKFRFSPGYVKGLFSSAPRPADVVVLKECSSYFPGELPIERKKQLMQSWITEVKAKKIKVMLATAVPVTKARSTQDPDKQASVLAFNDWIRDYARQNNIVLIDLEAALRTDERERYLRDEFTNGDGSHINRKAYDVLDNVMVEALCRIDAGVNCGPIHAATR